MKKTIGTLAPLSALWSSHDKTKKSTFATGRIFLDWLHTTRQNAWQLLPISETHLTQGAGQTRAPSPYKGYGVGLDPKYLSQEFRQKSPNSQQLKKFLRDNNSWLPDYALFCALRDHFKTDNWTTWDGDLRTRKPKALRAWRKKLRGDIQRIIVEQWQLHEDFLGLRRKALKLKIQLVGDLSFYLPLQSPLVWAYQHCFSIPKNGKLRVVSGSPDGPKAHFGRQVWGHPLYAWNKTDSAPLLRKLWKLRLGYQASLFSVLRLDHARGFYYYGAMNTADKRKDKIIKGPGRAMFKYIIKNARALGLFPFTEDSGDRLLNELRQDMHTLGVPGIRIFRFAYNEQTQHLSTTYAKLSSYPKNTVAYTTIHDTEPLAGYVKLLTENEKKLLCAASEIDYSKNDKRLAKNIKKAVLKSPANYVIVPIQDWIADGTRINTPGTEKTAGDKNWQYRIPKAIEQLPKNP